MNNSLLAIRWNYVADLSAVVNHTEAVDPCLPNGLTCRVVIGIALKIIHEQESNFSLINIGDLHTEKSIFDCSQRVQTRKSS